jgi:ABC-2 type transport system permease protein
MRGLFHILTFKLISGLKLNTDLSFAGLVKTLGSGILYLVFAAGAFQLTRLTVNYLLNEAHIGIFLLHRFISMSLFVFFITVSMGNILVAYTTLYKSSEVSYLFSKPISFTTVFLIKFLDNFFYSSATLFFIGAAVIAGYGSYFHLQFPLYIMIVFLVFIPLMLSAACVAGIILFGMLRLSSIFGALPVLMGTIAVYTSSIFLFFNFTNPSTLVQKVMRFYPHTDQSFVQFDPAFSKYLPNQWVAEFLYRIAKHNYTESFSYLFLLVGTTLLLFLILIWIANLYYRKSWLLSLEIKFFNKRKTNFEKNLFQRQEFFERQTDAIVKKDLLQFFREPVQFFHLAVMIFFMGIFSISIMHAKLAKVEPFLYSVFYTVVFLFTAFLLASLAVRFVYPAIGIEAKSFWKMRSSPIKQRKYFMIKYLFYLLPSFCIGVLLIILSNWQFRSNLILLVSITLNILFLTMTLISLNISAGCLLSDFNEKNPIRVASTQGASLTFLLSLVYLVFISVLIFILFDNYFHFKNLNTNLPWKILFTGTGISFFISSIISVVSLIVGVKSMKRDL